MTTPPETSTPVSAAPAGRRRLVVLLPLLAGAVTALAVVGLVQFGRATELTLESDPGGATAFLNGRLAGATPVTITGLEPGGYSLRLEKAGCIPLTRALSVGRGALRLREKLESTGTGTLAVDVQPRGAEVVLDGEFIGHTPLKAYRLSAGGHDLQIRKTNFKTFSQRIEVTAGGALEFKDFALEDVILTMLQSAIENDKQCVSNYCDLAHYYFANNQIKEAGDLYARAIQVGGSPLVLPPELSPGERDLEYALRAQEVNRLNDEIRKKSSGEGKVISHDLTAFRERIQRQQEINANKNISSWPAIQVQSNNLMQDNKLPAAEDLLLRHIEAAKGTPDLPQGYIALISLRIRMRKIKEVQQTCAEFTALYGSRPELVRQAGNALYSPAASFDGADRAALLDLAEGFMRRGIAETARRTELNALCKFELGNVLCLAYKQEEALPLYQESIENTHEPSTKELRSLRLVEALKVLKNFANAKVVLDGLLNSPRDEIVRRAQAELKEVEAALAAAPAPAGN